MRSISIGGCVSVFLISGVPNPKRRLRSSSSKALISLFERARILSGFCSTARSAAIACQRRGTAFAFCCGIESAFAKRYVPTMIDQWHHQANLNRSVKGNSGSVRKPRAMLLWNCGSETLIPPLVPAAVQCHVVASRFAQHRTSAPIWRSPFQIRDHTKYLQLADHFLALDEQPDRNVVPIDTVKSIERSEFKKAA